MKTIVQLVLVLIACAAVMMAQPVSITSSTTDVLGAHNVYGRGCVACHAPHGGPNGNNISGGTGAPVALWGQNLTPLFGQTLGFGDTGQYAVTLPSNGGITSAHDATTVIMLCLSCHDGNLAKSGMMKGTTVETLPVANGNAPTFLGNDAAEAGSNSTSAYNNDHPVGIKATFGCGGAYNWDCTITSSGGVTMTGAASSVFANTNYGFAVSLSTYTATTGGTPVPIVTCTSCHDQHAENIYSGKIAGKTGYFQTMFFLRGYYNPSNGGNSAAQFCRQCHGGESNEMHGQMGVPTI